MVQQIVCLCLKVCIEGIYGVGWFILQVCCDKEDLVQYVFYGDFIERMSNVVIIFKQLYCQDLNGCVYVDWNV